MQYRKMFINVQRAGGGGGGLQIFKGMELNNY